MTWGRSRIAAVAAAVLASGLGPATIGTAGVDAAETTETVEVRPTDPGDWVVQVDTCDGEPTGTAGFVEGPARAPRGQGSLRLAVGREGWSRPEALLPTLAGVRLDELTALSYSTFTLDESPAPYLELATDAAVLRFDPTGVGPDRWLPWDARAATWTVDGRPMTIDEFLGDHPDAVVVEPGLRVATGCDATLADAVGHVDDLTVGVAGAATTYDFEPDGLVVTVADVEVGEGDEDAKVTLSLSAESPDAITVTVVPTATGSASAPADFAANPGDVTFGPRERTASFPLSVVDDAIDEDDEWFSLVLTEVTGAARAGSPGTVTILDDDAAPKLSAIGTTVVEGSAGPPVAEVRFHRNGLTERTISFDYETRNGTANATDYQPTSGRLTIAPGDDPVLRIPVLADQVQEGTEQFTLLLANPVNAEISGPPAAVVIHDDDAGLPASVRVADLVVTEGRNAIVRLTRTGDLTRPVSVNAATGPGGPNAPATPGADFTAVNRTVSFEAGAATASLSVPIADDGSGESTESFVVALSNPIEAVLSDAEAVVTIVDSGAPTPPRSWLAVGDTSLPSEGDARRTSVRFDVHRTGAVDGPASVQYATYQVTALQGSDYIPASGTLTFAPGESYRTVDIAVAGDDTPETVETFELHLSDPSGAVIADRVGVATITDDDIDPTAGSAGLPTVLVIDDAVVVEGDSGTTDAVFTVRRLGDTSPSVGFRWSTGPGIRPAASPTDFTAVPSTPVTLASGVTETTLRVPVTGDTRDEKNERFVVYLTNASRAVVADTVGVATIVDDDGSDTPGPATFIAVRDALPGPEAGSHVFSVVRRGDLRGTSTVKAATASGTARSNTDFTAANATLTFGPGETERLFTVRGLHDLHTESQESLVVRLSAVSGAVVEDSRAGGTLLDDDPGLLLTSPPVTYNETDLPGQANVAVTLSHYAAQPVTVAYRTVTEAPGLSLSHPAATAKVDFEPVAGTLTFAPGEKTKTIAVPIVGDNLAEPGIEQFAVEFADPFRADLADPFTIVDIVDDDTVSITVDAIAPVSEAAGGVTVTARLSGPATHTITLGYATVNGTAVAGADFTGSTGTLAFEPGATERSFTVPITSDALFERTETFAVRFSPSGASYAGGDATVSIVDDDPMPTAAVRAASGPENAGTVVVPVELDVPSGVDTLVDAFFTAATAGAGDFDAGDRSVTIPAGAVRATVSVPVIDSYGCEGDQFFEVDILATDASVAPRGGRAAVTIRDIDCGGLVAHDAVVSEGAPTPTMRVTIPAPAPQRVRVGWQTEPIRRVSIDHAALAGGAAVAPDDFSIASGTVDILPGAVETTITLPITTDQVCEQPERLRVVLAAPVNAGIDRGAATVTITDDDCNGTVVWDGSETEGRPIAFVVSLPGAPPDPVELRATTSDGTAEHPSDYTKLDEHLVTVPRGRRTHVFTVPTMLGGACEQHETFSVRLTAGAGLPIARASATGTIFDLSGPCFTFDLATETVEGTDAVVRVAAIPSPLSPLAVRYRTWDGTAMGTPVPSADFETPAPDAAVWLAAGQGEVDITVATYRNAGCEPRDHFLIDITPDRGTPRGAQRTGFINDPDCGDNGVMVLDPDTILENGRPARFSFRLHVPQSPGKVQAFRFVTEDRTATAGDDYIYVSRRYNVGYGDPPPSPITVDLNPWTPCREGRKFKVKLYAEGTTVISDGSVTVRIPNC